MKSCRYVRFFTVTVTSLHYCDDYNNSHEIDTRIDSVRNYLGVKRDALNYFPFDNRNFSLQICDKIC
jgi:hypothetical protein